MNIRLQKYKKNRLDGMNKYNAARAAGYSHNYAHQAKPEKVAKASIADAFEQAGLTDKKIIEHALDGLNATREIIIDGAKFGDQPEWGIRHKYFETILKLTDRMKEKAAVEINQYTQVWNTLQKKAQDVESNGRVHITDKKEVPA